MSIKNCLIINGAAQFTQPKVIENPLDLLKLIVKVCRLAITDTKIINENCGINQ